jgi:hypothetical protein
MCVQIMNTPQKKHCCPQSTCGRHQSPHTHAPPHNINRTLCRRLGGSCCSTSAFFRRTITRLTRWWSSSVFLAPAWPSRAVGGVGGVGWIG